MESAVRIKDCLVCKLNPKAARAYIEDWIDPRDEYGTSSEDPIGQEMYKHMSTTHVTEIEGLADRVWDNFRKIIDEAL